MTKRSFDVVLGTLLAVLALPLILSLALFSAARFGCWPFFVQKRIGLSGKPFRIIKIRTLPPTAPASVDKFAVAAMPLPRWSTVLRSSHLDELPQLFLVPLGRMSLVGPRPEMPFLHEQGDAAFAELRTTVRPGCTGLWQVSRAAGGLIWQASEFDMLYLREHTLRLDLWILARTPLLAVRRGSSLGLDDIPRWTRVPLRLCVPGTRVLPTPYPREPRSSLPAPTVGIHVGETVVQSAPLRRPATE
jgi:lipopolysaccharide/colanic/teichoic acid biosynthesis glycosyltransferase